MRESTKQLICAICSFFAALISLISAIKDGNGLAFIAAVIIFIVGMIWVSRYRGE